MNIVIAENIELPTMKKKKIELQDNNSIISEIERMSRHKNLALNVQSEIVDYLLDNGESEKAYRVSDCGSYLMYRQYHDPQKTLKLNRANFCKHPLCPLCQWRKSLKQAAYIDYAMNKCQDNLYHLILTMQNVQILSSEQLKELKKAAKEFIRKELRCYSYIVSLEVTYSAKKGYHPHLHVLLDVPHIIINYDSTFMNELSMLRKKWFNYMPTDYGYTILAIYKITDENRAKSVSELSKYIIKPEKNTENIIEAIPTMIKAIYGIRKIDSSGYLRQYLAEAKKALSLEAEKEKTYLEAYRYDIYMYIYNGIQYIPYK